MSGKFRVTVWDPVLIISQIVAVQGAFYASFGLLVALGTLLTPSSPTLSTVFSYKAINFTDKQGVITIVSYLVNPLIGAVALWVLVKRTKQCLDFTVTAYLIHMMMCWLYNGYLPNTVLWWILTAAAITIMCVTGEFLCLKSELEDIPLLGARVDL